MSTKTVIDANKLIRSLDNHFEVPNDVFTLMKLAGLTDRMATSIEGMIDEGRSVTSIAKELTGTPHTQNVYDAVDSGIKYLIRGIFGVRLLSENPDIVKLVLEKTINEGRIDVGVPSR